jgi:hypothetical protein
MHAKAPGTCEQNREINREIAGIKLERDRSVISSAVVAVHVMSRIAVVEIAGQQMQILIKACAQDQKTAQNSTRPTYVGINSEAHISSERSISKS